MDSKNVVKNEPLVDEDGIWMPIHKYGPEGETEYKLVMTADTFREAYRKYIKEDTAHRTDSLAELITMIDIMKDEAKNGEYSY